MLYIIVLPTNLRKTFFLTLSFPEEHKLSQLLSHSYILSIQVLNKTPKYFAVSEPSKSRVQQDKPVFRTLDSRVPRADN